MTFLYTRTNTWNSAPQPNEETIKYWKHISENDTWIDVTRRETITGAEQAIDASIEHYSKKLEFVKGPKVVKTFE